MGLTAWGIMFMIILTIKYFHKLILTRKNNDHGKSNITGHQRQR